MNDYASITEALDNENMELATQEIQRVLFLAHQDKQSADVLVLIFRAIRRCKGYRDSSHDVVLSMLFEAAINIGILFERFNQEQRVHFH